MKILIVKKLKKKLIIFSVETTDESNELNQNNYKELVQKLNAISENSNEKAIRLEVAPGVT